MTHVLAVDVGTSSLRAVEFDEAGHPVREVARLRYEPDAQGELDPEPIVNAIPQRADAWSVFWHSLLLLDDRGRPLAPVSTWLDSRAAADAVQLARQVDGDVVHARTGAPLHFSFWPAKIRRLQREGVRFARIASLGDYLRLRFDGAWGTSVSLASGTGLLDVRRLAWDEELLELLGVDESALPPLTDDGVWLGDGAAANIGAGGVGERAAVTVGTSAAVRVVRDDGAASRGLFLYRLDRSRYVLGGAISDGGNLLVWLSRLTGGEVGDAVDRRPGLVAFLPHLGGERSPGWRAHAQGAIAGLTLSTTAEDLVQAAFEGISYRLGTILDQLVCRELVGTGTALRPRPGWAQLLADVFGKPVTMSAVAEASARGAAVVALGVENEPAPLGERFEPRPERSKQHRDARERLDALYRATASA